MSNTEALSVRFAGPDDVPAVCAIVNHYILHDTSNLRTEVQSEDEWADELATYGGHYPWLVAEEAGIVVGMAYAKPWNPRGAYDWTAESTIYIADGQTGKGVGSALYGRLFKLLEQQGFRSVMAGTTSPNPGSEALHTAFGFRKVGTLREAGYKFGTWYDVVLWQRELASLDDPPRPTTPVERWDEGL
ncbi:GNAT family N-acetyltransferase [Glycomyces xiaoerkulensis]|uniref:GNAT family N-acetyltransferase n=1 Tax=Glycomyces xiaoerkulensis TaxID=2038139 RepID=UPI000C25C0D8|nr:GNAT family N-acetyltransferase [Glycomyces xiaoerkulensis]